MGKIQQPSLMDDPGQENLTDLETGQRDPTNSNSEQVNLTNTDGDQQNLTDEAGDWQASEIVKMECTVASQTRINGVIHNYSKGEILDITLAEAKNLPCDRWKKV